MIFLCLNAFFLFIVQIIILFQSAQQQQRLANTYTMGIKCIENTIFSRRAWPTSIDGKGGRASISCMRWKTTVKTENAETVARTSIDTLFQSKIWKFVCSRNYFQLKQIALESIIDWELMKLFVFCLPFCQSMRSHGCDINELSVACSIAKKKEEEEELWYLTKISCEQNWFRLLETSRKSHNFHSKSRPETNDLFSQWLEIKESSYLIAIDCV